MSHSHLIKAYEKTSFRVNASPDTVFAIRCGEHSPILDALLGKSGASTWAYITACNPGSTLLSPEENEERMCRLRVCIERLGHVFLPGEGVPDKAGWPPEPSFLVVGITEQEAASLARLFQQKAILVGSHGACARLLWVSAGTE